MKSQFAFLIDEQFKWVFHEHLTYLLGLIAEGGGEHHYLSLFAIAFHEYLLDLGSHVRFYQHFVAFIENEKSELIEFHVSLINQLQNSAWCSDDDVWSFITLKNGNIFFDWHASIEDTGSDVLHVGSKTIYFFFDLVSEFSDIA